MSEEFVLNIPKKTGMLETIVLKNGEVLFLLGANGAGKSSLVSYFCRSHPLLAIRISAQRQNWIQPHMGALTAETRDAQFNHLKNEDQTTRSRYIDAHGHTKQSIMIFDLISQQQALAGEVLNLLKTGRPDEALCKSKSASPFDQINELMSFSNMPISLELTDTQNIVARRHGGLPYQIAELSDGERNAFLIAAEVLTAKPGSLMIIDEPERHLHRSIISPLLTQLFQKRNDCTFIVSTHDVMLPLDNRSAKTLLVRSCNYQNSMPVSWTTNTLEPDEPIDDELKKDILGSRQKIIFVEGKLHSLDTPLYSLLFPQASIIPKESCRDVEHAVRGLSAVEDKHWVKVWGIVDNDRRSSEDIGRLRKLGVYALPYFSVEALYYHPEIISRVIDRKVDLTGGDQSEIFIRTTQAAISAIQNKKENLVLSVIERSVRVEMFNSFPRKNDLRSQNNYTVKIDVARLRTIEELAFDQAVANKNLAALLQRYPLRDSGALSEIVRAIGLSKSDYQVAVLKILREDPTALAFLKSLFEDLADEVAKPL